MAPATDAVTGGDGGASELPLDAAAAIQEAAECVLPWWSRTFCGYQERFALPFKMALGGIALEVRQAPCGGRGHAQEASGSSDAMCTGSTVWDAGVVLAAYLLCGASGLGCHVDEESRKATASAPRCLELGSGTGLVGLAAAASGRFGRVLLSDLATLLPLVRENLQHNAAAIPPGIEAEAIALQWESQSHLRRVRLKGPFDVILGGDLLFRPPVVTPLLGALHELADQHTTVLLAASAQHSPETLRDFWSRASQSFRIELLPAEAQAPEYSSPEVLLLRLTRGSQVLEAALPVASGTAVVGSKRRGTPRRRPAAAKEPPANQALSREGSRRRRRRRSLNGATP